MSRHFCLRKYTSYWFFLKIVSSWLHFSVWAVCVGRWYPSLLFGLLVDHACFNIPVKGKLGSLQVVLAAEAIGVKYFVVIRAQLDGVRALDVTDKVLILVLLEGVRHGLGQDGHEG